MTFIHTETYGQGKPIVLVHGWAMHSGIWRGFAKELAKNYRVTLVDLPGHGHSQPLSSFTLQTVSEALIKAVHVEKSCWLGWSLGAEIVIEIARRWPGWVSSMILLAGSPCFIRKDFWPGIGANVLDSFAMNLHNDVCATLVNFLSLQTQGLAHQKLVLRELKTVIFDNPVPDSNTLLEGLGVLKQTDLRSVFTEINIPISAILGELDTLVPVAVGTEMEKLSPTLELKILKRAGHVPFLSHREELLSVIDGFMGKLNVG